MRPSLIKRLESLEADRGGQIETMPDQEQALLDILIEAYYSGQDPQLTPAQEQMLADTERCFRDAGLWDLYFGPDKEQTP